MATGTFTEKNNNNNNKGLNFNVYTDVDNREIAIVRDKKQRTRISLEKNMNENFTATVRKWGMRAATKVKMSGSEKIKANRNSNHISWIRRVETRKSHVVVVQNNGKEMYN